jgi:hypothetical protein
MKYITTALRLFRIPKGGLGPVLAGLAISYALNKRALN